MSGVDLSYPVILMDHQPFNLPAAASKGADLQLSGHTHHGQIFPINLITNAIYEVSHGITKIGETNFYVSTGSARGVRRSGSEQGRRSCVLSCGLSIKSKPFKESECENI